jgi:hypothetical protein
MLYRLVCSVTRRDSSHSQVTQRIPADVLPRAAGLKISIPLGSGEFHRLTISLAMKALRSRSTVTLAQDEREAPLSGTGLQQPCLSSRPWENSMAMRLAAAALAMSPLCAMADDVAPQWTRMSEFYVRNDAAVSRGDIFVNTHTGEHLPEACSAGKWCTVEVGKLGIPGRCQGRLSCRHHDHNPRRGG